MTEPLTPPQIEAEIVRLCGLLELATTQLAKRARDKAEKRVAYKTAHAKAYLFADGTIAEREATATVATEQEHLDYEAAEATTLGALEAGRNLREQLQALRSLNANVRQLT